MDQLEHKVHSHLTFSMDVNDIFLVHNDSNFFIMVLLGLNRRYLCRFMDIQVSQVHLSIILGELRPALVFFILNIFCIWNFSIMNAILQCECFNTRNATYLKLHCLNISTNSSGDSFEFSRCLPDAAST